MLIFFVLDSCFQECELICLFFFHSSKRKRYDKNQNTKSQKNNNKIEKTYFAGMFLLICKLFFNLLKSILR